MTLIFRRPVCLGLLAACCVLAGTPAQAQMRYAAVQVAIGAGSLTTQTDPSKTGALTWMAGYRFNQDFALQAVGFEPSTPYHQPVVAGAAPLYDFTRFIGVQGVAYLPLTSSWDFYGALGAGQSSLAANQPGAGSQSQTDVLAAIGVHWAILPHIGATIDVTRLNKTGVTNSSLRAEFTF